MLSSESETEMNLSTATEQLEDQLKALLQAGGAMKKKASKKSKKASKKSKKSSKKSKKSSKKSKKSSKKSKKSKRKMKSEESTVENEVSEQSTENSTPVEPKAKETKPKRKANPALKAFAELSKHVSTKLGISNGPPAKKIAGQVKRDTAEKFPDLPSVEVMKKAIKHFDQYMEKYKKMI